MCFICNDHNFIILFWFTNASLHECLMIWMLNELCNNTVDLSWYIVTYVIFTYAYFTGMIVWEDIWISLPLRWLFVYRLRLRQNVHKQVGYFTTWKPGTTYCKSTAFKSIAIVWIYMTEFEKSWLPRTQQQDTLFTIKW